VEQKNCKYSSWLTDYTFENCKLNRKEYGEFLIDYIVGEKNGFVLNLNGEWGTGKTQFLRRFYSGLIKRKHPTIYIDAWESDFSDIPLSVVSSELINQLSCVNENIGSDLEKVSEFLGKALKGAIIGGAGLLSKSLLGEASAGTEVVKALFEQSPKDFLGKVKGDHVEQIDAIKQIRKQLGLLAEVIKTNYGCSLPIVVLVDELDRCRPTYAIEMLEVIKHFFTTENFVFVIATDTEQLKNSIKAVYGSEFDSSTYLKRFFNREARLPSPDIEHYLSIQDLNFSDYENKIVIYPNLRTNIATSTNNYLEWASKAYNLSIRDIDQLIDKLKSCLRTVLSTAESSDKKQYVNLFCLIAALVEFDKNLPQFDSRKEDKPKADVSFEEDFGIDISLGYKNMYTDYYRINMHTSVMHNIQIINNWGESVNKKVYGVHSKTGIIFSQDYDGVIQSTVRNIENIFQQVVNNKDSKVWLWEDYKQVVKLAGNIV
jgi:hypothetical protein